MNLTAEMLTAAIEEAGNWNLPHELAERLLPFIERHIAAGQQGAGDFGWVASEVLALASERDKGYANREHGGVLNGRIADKVVSLARRLATPQPPKTAGAEPEDS